MRLLSALFLALSLISGTAYSQATTTPATNSLASFWQASVTAESGKDYDTAIKQLTGYQQAGGNPFLVNLRAGWIYYLKQDYKNATGCYNEAARLQPTAINPLLGLLNVAQAGGNSTEIQRAIDNILHLDPLNYRAQMAGAVLQFKGKSYREALSYYRRVLQYYPDDFEALSGEGWSLYYLGQQKQAAADFQTLLSVNPDYPYAKQGLDLALGKSTD